jgi:hypothetical protein
MRTPSSGSQLECCNFEHCFQALANASASIGWHVEGSAAQAGELKTKGEQNMKTKLIIYALAALTVINGTQAQSRAGNAALSLPTTSYAPRPIVISARLPRMEVSANSPTIATLGRSTSSLL